ncbi:MAG: NAD(P)H-dependent oxidoreductase [Planctomycetes bacterium]|nr:NAD(P)H-dependent oxidoreductase [Planctomycetota bacterium]
MAKSVSASPAKPRILIISSSLNPASHSRVLCRAAEETLRERGVPVEFIDLAQNPIPVYNDFDGHDPGPAVASLRAAAERAQGFLLGIPVYIFGTPSPLKAAVEFIGKRFEGKVVGGLAAAGGTRSYMSVMDVAKSLQLDFRCLWVPRYAYGTHDQFADGRIQNDELLARVRETALQTAALAARLATPVLWADEPAR